MSEHDINVEAFFRRLERIQTHWAAHPELWGEADAVCVPFGNPGDEDTGYSKHVATYLYLLGWEFPGTLMVLVRDTFFFLSTTKKCDILRAAVEGAATTSRINIQILVRNKEDNNRANFTRILDAVKRAGTKLGMPVKEDFPGPFASSWMAAVDEQGLTKVDIAAGLSGVMSMKDADELDTVKKASIMTHKVMKHGFLPHMENIIDKEKHTTHEDLAKYVEGIIYDPSKIKVNVPPNQIESCYFPIVQSGGIYDLRPTARTDDNELKHDVIIISLGARYKNYCASMSRTFMIDPPPKVRDTYNVLMQVYEACLSQMVHGVNLNRVAEEARQLLDRKHPELAAYLPKSLGFAIGLEFRDTQLSLNTKNTATFQQGQAFVLSVGFQNVPLLEGERQGSDLNAFSLLIADTVVVQREGAPDLLTKFSKDFGDVSYYLKDGQDEDDDNEVKMEEGGIGGGTGVRLRSREDRHIADNQAQQRQERQTELMKRKIAEHRRKNRNNGDDGDGDEKNGADDAEEICTYRSPAEYPRDVSPNQIKVDMDREAVIVPINGQPVPFHISTIKNVVLPEPDRATYLRINFFTAGQTIGKDTPKNMANLIMKHEGEAIFIKELTFRSLDSKNLNQAFRLIQELRKRVRQAEAKKEAETGLVEQAKLVKLKDQRVPRLQDLIMRPQLTGRKTTGTLESHTNGLRFTSNKGEQIDVMYNNIAHAIYQPCENEVMVLIHFHLKNEIMIGKKKHRDIQFYTDVIDASQNLDGARRSMYDPDELEEEQRERTLRKRLNEAFRDFSKKVEKVAKAFDFDIEFDTPYRDLGFTGTPFKEMVTMLPTVRCLVSLTETPFLVVDLDQVEHVHFERVSFNQKTLDMIVIFKDFKLPVQQISLIDKNSLADIQEWLTHSGITYTAGPRSLNWKVVMEAVRDDPVFFDDKDEDGEKKPAGWLSLSAEHEEEEQDDDDEGGDSAYSEAGDDSDEDEDDSDDDSDGSEFADEDESEEDEEESEEEGESWEELERQAKASDKAKRDVEEDERPTSRKKPRR